MNGSEQQRSILVHISRHTSSRMIVGPDLN